MIYEPEQYRELLQQQVKENLKDTPNPTLEEVQQVTQQTHEINEAIEYNALRQKLQGLTSALIDVLPDDKLLEAIDDVLTVYFRSHDHTLKNIDQELKEADLDSDTELFSDIYNKPFTKYEKDFSSILTLSKGLRAYFFCEKFEIVLLGGYAEYIGKPSSILVIEEAIKGYELIGVSTLASFARCIKNGGLTEATFENFRSLFLSAGINNLFIKYIRENSEEFII